MDHPELVDHLAEVASSTEDICLRVVAIGHAQIFRSAWHQLAESDRASVTDRERVISRFSPDQSIKETAGQGELRLGGVDVRKVSRPTKA